MRFIENIEDHYSHLGGSCALSSVSLPVLGRVQLLMALLTVVGKHLAPQQVSEVT